MQHIQVNGLDLEYVNEGSGVPVLFSHGGGSDLRYWEPQREAFATRYRFITYSRRFHGVGTWPTEGDYSTEAHMADMLAIMRGLRAGPIHLIGFSTTLALRIALRAPDLIRSLTIIEPNVPWLLEGDSEGEAILAWWRFQNERVLSEAAGDAVRQAKLWFELVNNQGAGVFDRQPEELRQMWLNNFGTKRPVTPAPAPLTCEQLGSISVPTLIIGAEYGMPYSRRIVDVLSTCISTSRRKVISGVTHFMSYQHPAVFNEVVFDFLAQHP